MSTSSSLLVLTIVTSMSQLQRKAYASTPPHPLPLCTDDADACEDATYINNSVCDDSGELAANSMCRLGTDCMDCGPRCPAGYQLSSDEKSCHPCDVANAITYSRHCQVSHCEGTLFPNAARTACVDTADDTPGCNNDCSYRDNGFCDDYGHAPEGSKDCRAGSDCGDCGPRIVEDCLSKTLRKPATELDETGAECVPCVRTGAATFVNVPGCVIESCDTSSVFNYVLTDGRCVPAEAPGCTYECPGHNGNGICEDGHPNQSDESICKLGTDCGDCEQRSLIPCNAMQEQVYDEHEDQVCIDCSREYYPNAKTFDTTAQGCVITECDDGHHLIQVRGHVQFCSPYAEGPGCQFDFGFGFDGECDDGGEGSMFTITPLGSDCGDCSPRCLHHTEFDAATGRCEPCSRPGVLHYTHDVGCVIYSCMDGYEQQGTGVDAVCEATPTAPTATAPTTGSGGSPIPTAPTTGSGGSPTATAPTTGSGSSPNPTAPITDSGSSPTATIVASLVAAAACLGVGGCAYYMLVHRPQKQKRMAVAATAFQRSAVFQQQSGSFAQPSGDFTSPVANVQDDKYNKVSPHTNSMKNNKNVGRVVETPAGGTHHVVLGEEVTKESFPLRTMSQPQHPHHLDGIGGAATTSPSPHLHHNHNKHFAFPSASAANNAMVGLHASQHNTDKNQHQHSQFLHNRSNNSNRNSILHQQQQQHYNQRGERQNMNVISENSDEEGDSDDSLFGILENSDLVNHQHNDSHNSDISMAKALPHQHNPFHGDQRHDVTSFI